jgi:hypothetical protein
MGSPSTITHLSEELVEYELRIDGFFKLTAYLLKATR